MSTTAISFHLQPGQKVTLQPLSWQGFEAILSQLREHRKYFTDCSLSRGESRFDGD